MISIFPNIAKSFRDGELSDWLCLAAFCAMTNQSVQVYTLKNFGMNPTMTYSAMANVAIVSTRRECCMNLLISEDNKFLREKAAL